MYPWNKGNKKYIFICKNCGKEQKTFSKRKKYCNFRCYFPHLQRRLATKKGTSKYVSKEEKRLADLASGRKSYRKHKESRLHYYRQLSYKRRHAKGKHTLREWNELKERFDNKCVFCGASNQLTRDHIIPISKGGNSFIENIQPLCRSCNSKKYNN